MPFRLRSTYGPIYPLDRLLYIGRDETCQIRPPDSLVSRVHAAVWVDRGLVQVRDEHASNGTFVNGLRLASGQTRPLKPGDQLQVGNSLFTLEGAATSAADISTQVEPPALAIPTDAAPAPMTLRAPEPSLAPTRAAPLPADLAAPPGFAPPSSAQPYTPPAPPRRGLSPWLLLGVGCLFLLVVGLCLVFGFFLTSFGQDLLLRLFG